jgi:hypothetical protein
MGIDTKPPEKPAPAGARVRNGIRTTARQAERLRNGQRESSPSDYASFSSETMRRQANARRLLEERQVLRDLGLLD